MEVAGLCCWWLVEKTPLGYRVVSGGDVAMLIWDWELINCSIVGERVGCDEGLWVVDSGAMGCGLWVVGNGYRYSRLG